MTNDQINRMLAVNLMGVECWHVFQDDTCSCKTCSANEECCHCGKLKHQVPPNPDYISEVGFFRLLERAKEQEWWGKFEDWYMWKDNKSGLMTLAFMGERFLDAINYKTFPRLLCEFGVEVKGWE